MLQFGQAIRRATVATNTHTTRRAFSVLPNQTPGAGSGSTTPPQHEHVAQTPAVKLGPRDFWRWFNTPPDKKSASWAQRFRRGTHSYKRIVFALSMFISAKLIYDEEKKKPQLLKPWMKCPAEPLDMDEILQWNNVLVPSEQHVEDKKSQEKYYT